LVGTPVMALFERDDLTDFFRLNPFASIGAVTGTNTNIQLHPLETDGDTHIALFFVRLYSTLLGLGTLWCVFEAGRLMWDEWTGVLAMFVAASVPTFIHISASANNDNLNALMSSVVVVLALHAWQGKQLTNRVALATGAALAAAAITKLTGLAAYGFAVGMALVGGAIGRLGWRDVARYIAIIAGAGAVLAGWWYIRSVMVYGDPLAYDAARALWGREIDAPSGFELWGVWESFWMTLGHLNVPGPPWFTPYVTVATAVALVGVGVRAIREPESRWRLVFLVLVFLTVAGTMIYVTRRMNISQGRALFPAMTAIAPLLVVGWRALLGKRLFWIPAMPIAAVAATAPFFALGSAFVPLEPVASVPNDISRVDTRAETITVYGYDLLTETVGPGGAIAVDLYFEGGHDENPALFITAQHPVTGERLGKVDTYPGMAPTDLLDNDQIYRARVQLRLDNVRGTVAPFQTELAFGWRVPDEDDPGQGRFVDWFDGEDEQIGGVFGAGPVVIAPGYEAPPAPNETIVAFGDVIRLRGYDKTQDGDETVVQLWWERTAPMTTDWTLTVGLADADGELLVQDDGPVPAYPTSAWADTPVFTTTHHLATDVADAALRVGWYQLDGGRLSVSDPDGATVRDDLVFLE
ncbi:MAG: hypothetical protein AAF125_12350, partial [Chloroflexota bacterium]